METILLLVHCPHCANAFSLELPEMVEWRNCPKCQKESLFGRLPSEENKMINGQMVVNAKDWGVQ